MAASSGETTPVRLGALLDAGENPLVTLVAGDTRLAAHKAVLAARSTVFEKMFQHGWEEERTAVVPVGDVEGPVLREMVEYCYTLQAPQLPAMADKMLAAADKYGLLALKEQCEQMVARQLTVETVAAAAVLTVRHECPILQQAVGKFMMANANKVPLTQGWKDALAALHGNLEATQEFTCLLGGPPAKKSAAAAAAGRQTSCPGSQDPPRSRGEAPTTAAAPQDPPPVEAAAQYWTLSSEEKGQRLIRAAQEGAVGEVQSLLAAGADVGAMDDDRWTALHWAAAKGDEDTARCLLVSGAKVEARDVWLATPLILAAEYGREAVVRLLLECSADVNARDEDGMTPLHYATIRCQSQMAAALLRAGAFRHTRASNGSTPRSICASNRAAMTHQVVDLLLRTRKDKLPKN